MVFNLDSAKLIAVPGEAYYVLAVFVVCASVIFFMRTFTHWKETHMMTREQKENVFDVVVAMILLSAVAFGLIVMWKSYTESIIEERSERLEIREMRIDQRRDLFN